LTRAHAQGLETESISYAEAQAIARQIRASGKAISNQSVLSEVRDRDLAIEKRQRQKRQQTKARDRRPEVPQLPASAISELPPKEPAGGRSDPWVEELLRTALFVVEPALFVMSVLKC